MSHRDESERAREREALPNSDCAVRDCNAIFNLMGGGGVLKEERRRKKTKQNKDV